MAALLCVALALVPMFGSRRQSVRLPSGEVVTLLGVVKGQTPFLFPHTPVSRFLASIHLTNGLKFGPLKYPAIRSFTRLYEMGDPLGKPGLTNRMMVILGHGCPTNRFPLGIGRGAKHWSMFAKATIADGSGEEWESGFVSGYMGSGLGAGARMTTVGIPGWKLSEMDLNQLSFCGFATFPRRGAELRFRVYTNSPDQGWRTVVDFKLPNPYCGDYPRWQASPLPAVARNAELEASLLSISCDSHLAGAAGRYQVSTFCKLRLLENGQPRSQWIPKSLHAIDATGNEWFSELATAIEGNEGFWTVKVHGKVFSPSEVWRMSFTFVREQLPEPLRLRAKFPTVEDSRTFDFLVQPPTNPPSFKTPFPASSR